MKLMIETLSIHTKVLICYNEDKNHFFAFNRIDDLLLKLSLHYGMIEPSLRSLFSDDDYFFLIENEKRIEVGFRKNGSC